MSAAAASKSGQKVDLLLPAVFFDDSIVCLAARFVDRSGSCVHFAAALLRKVAVLNADQQLLPDQLKICFDAGHLGFRQGRWPCCLEHQRIRRSTGDQQSHNDLMLLSPRLTVVLG